MNKKTGIVLLLITALLFASCVAGPNDMAGLTDQDGKTAGFFMGIWHGMISLFAFIISIFSDKINVYEVHNNGGWYNLGFIIGVSIFYGGGTKGAGHGRRRNRD
ncbi:MAG: hypothetical protein JEY99_01560 [Spirochaetales bacterium]|nr:hypothetical protein [Spirochaetales bacterium]